MKVLMAALALGGMTAAAWAQQTPAGLWRTIDDDGKTVKSHVRIQEQSGVYSAVVEKVLDPKAPPNAKCDLCKDDRKDKPIVGLEIMRGVKADGEGVWAGGEILDPDDGKTYRVRLKPLEGGKRLEVRGYIGAPLFGRSQTWQRLE
ncbi:DUF2147 domain-containing protein [Inhella gelatinilytica]|uniref:DUF2147 domain-containing protein n=1 Tax=Inhella gelatinilytica TaxID=2795030 RepID=A0A931IVH3_9BURK|nr:DUF2147 domain-containing protein [Inhella gelatinilytica]MBH9552311.1 DUF2147 domain-containing protein [Inhella gelatinilytica]